MAKLILIAAHTHYPGINEIGDFVDVYEDNVQLGDSYSTFTIVDLPGVPVSEVMRVMELYATEERKNTKYQFNLSDVTKSDFALLLDSKRTDAEKIQVIAKAKKRS